MNWKKVNNLHFLCFKLKLASWFNFRFSSSTISSTVGKQQIGLTWTHNVHEHISKRLLTTSQRVMSICKQRHQEKVVVHQSELNHDKPAFISCSIRNQGASLGRGIILLFAERRFSVLERNSIESLRNWWKKLWFQVTTKAGEGKTCWTIKVNSFFETNKKWSLVF